MQKEYVNFSDENIFDIAVKLYGDVSYAFDLGFENGIDLDGELPAQTILFVPEKLEDVVFIDVPEIEVVEEKPVYMNFEGQTIFDVAVQLYGDVSKAFDLCQLNPISLDGNLKSHQQLVHDNIDSFITNNFRLNNVIVNTTHSIVLDKNNTAKPSAFTKGFLQVSVT